MGVYFSTKIVWGLRVSETFGMERLEEFDPRVPEGFTFTPGGDMMNSENVSYVIHPKDRIKRLLHSNDYNSEQYGVFRLQEQFTHTDEEVATLLNFAREYGLDEDIDFFVMVSVD